MGCGGGEFVSGSTDFEGSFESYGDTMPLQVRIDYPAVSDGEESPAATEGAPFPVADGITLVVAPDIVGSGQDPVPIIERLTALLSDILKEAPDADDPDDATD